MTLGQKLKKLRIEKGLTQKDLADQLHVTFQTISKWEGDTNEPDFSTLKELAKTKKRKSLKKSLPKMLKWFQLFRPKRKLVHAEIVVRNYLMVI
jgi:transcriptional regulator with XRE-family HTH domain